MREEHHTKGKKLHMCFALELRKKEIPEVLTRSVMSLHEGAKTRVRDNSVLSEEFEVKVRMHQGSVLSPFLFNVVVDVITEFASEGALCKLEHAGDLVMMSETTEGLINNFIKWKEAFENKGLKVNFGKTKVIVSGSITKDGMSKRKVVPCGVSSLTVKVNSVLHPQCGKWIHGTCAGVKKVTPKF